MFQRPHLALTCVLITSDRLPPWEITNTLHAVWLRAPIDMMQALLANIML